MTGVAVGFAFDAGSGKELTSVFSGLYVLGCLAAVLAVQQAGIFTAVIQPPLILFCAVPGAYFLFHGAKFTGVKDLVINCGYPLIERFPLMLFTSAGVLLIGLVRWYLGVVQSRSGEADADDAADADGKPGLVARLASTFNRDNADADAAEKPRRPRARREHAVERSARSAERRSGRRTTASSRTRRPRPGADEAEKPRERTRRRPTRDYDADEPPRRSRQPRDVESRGRTSRDVRRDPQARRARPTGRTSRFEPYEAADSFDAPPPRRRPASNGQTATHHPISQVRYRKAAGGDEPYERRPRRPSSDWD